MLNIYAQLPCTKVEVKQHTEALSEMSKNAEHKALFDHLYECLSIIDSKSASLLSFNAIIIAIFAIFISGKQSPVEAILLGFGVFLVLASSLLLLFVVWIHWSDTKELNDLDGHAITLLKVRRTRTIRYRIAWYFSVGAIIILTIFLLIRIAIA